MRVDTAERQVSVSAPSTARRSQIHATPAMFKILYSQLYTHKELAVVRELLANAWDAHVEAGTTDTPIEVHLPTSLEPYFEIRDFGTGMAPEQVPPVYMDYGNSTKTHTNELIGGFGIGSKSPFSFTDQFTVTTRWNGKAYTFSAYLSEDGGPACIQMGEQDTDAPNGLTVHVPVEDNFFVHDAFERAFRRIAPFMPTTPVAGLDDLEPTPYDLDFEPDIPGISRVAVRFNFRHTPSFNVVQGIVPYEVDTHAAGLETETRAQRSFARQAQIYAWADIGEFEVTGNREALSLTSEMKSKLQATYQAAIEALISKAEAEAATAKNWFQWASIREATDLQFKPPADWADVCIDDGLLDFQKAFGDPAFRGLYRLNRRRKDLAERASNPTRFRAGYFQQGVHVVASPKKSYSVLRYARKYFMEESAAHDHVMAFDGTVAEVQRVFDQYGIPVKVEEMPYIAPPARNRAALGRASYPVRHFHKVDGKWQAPNYERAATDFLDEVEADEIPFMLTSSPGQNRRYMSWLYNGLVKPRHDEVRLFRVNPAHTRVRDTLLKHELCGDFDDLFEWRQDTLDQIATAQAQRDQIYVSTVGDLHTRQMRTALGRLEEGSTTTLGLLNDALVALNAITLDINPQHGTALSEAKQFYEPPEGKIDQALFDQTAATLDLIKQLVAELERNSPELIEHLRRIAMGYYVSAEDLLPTIDALLKENNG